MIFLALLVTFSELKEIKEGEQIAIKGYITKRDNEVNLTSLPDVKSCCLHKVEHLKIAGSVPEISPFKVVTLIGIYENGMIKPTRVE